jgi:hypothetical protein
MTTLTKANGQWERRAPDERFSSVEAMHAAALTYQQEAAEADVRSARSLRVRAVDGDDVVLESKSGRLASLTNWSFGQLANRAKAPAAYLRTLPAEVAAMALNCGLETAPEDEDEDRGLRLLFKSNGTNTLRAITSRKYGRIWNADVTKRLVALKEQGPWQEAPQAFDGSRGQYLSDRDMFSFFVDNDRRIFETKNGGLSRGFFAWNSEVGAASFGVMTFLYEYVCGNHRVWGAQNISEVRIRHVGASVDERAFRELRAVLVDYAEGSAEEDELKIERARTYELGTNKEEVIDAVFGLKLIPRKIVHEAYCLAEKREDWYGNPRSAWGMGGALTEIARDLPNADERVSLERAGTKVLELSGA